MICQCIAGCVTGRPRFWYIAFKIIDKYPNSVKIRMALTKSVGPVGGGWVLEITKDIEECRTEIERLWNDPTTPESARPWLEELKSSLSSEIQRWMRTRY